MKLIDLLARELPKRGGWPECAAKAEVFTYERGIVNFWTEEGKPFNGGANNFRMKGLSLCEVESVTRAEYEAALSASQKPAWNGEGLPPVGCECEWRDTKAVWIPVTIKYISEQIVVMASPTNLCGVLELTETAKDIICDKPQFRPLRTEKDKKRDDIVESILTASGIRPRDGGKQSAIDIYEAIAAGKIPGVKLEG